MTCPRDYALHFHWDNAPSCSTLYVVGGLYGNFQALQALFSCIEPDALVVFNGDIHWFDASKEQFVRIEKAIAPYILLNGNVEAELAREIKSGAGCGCFYPETTHPSTVEWAHQIHERLSHMVDTELPKYKEHLSKRPSCLGLFVGEHKIAITHGDESSLAGWMCSKESLQHPQRQKTLDGWLKHHDVSVLASSHTCEAVLLSLPHGVVINNGAAGLPNFKALGSGIITRISTKKATQAAYGTRYKNLFIDAIELHYDALAFMKSFEQVWDKSSPASLSYRNRIEKGTSKKRWEVKIKAFHDERSFEKSIPSHLRHTTTLHTMQLNLGKMCNLSCKHCHVEASPHRTERMSKEVMQKALDIFEKHRFKTLDITGGAPEMNEHFEWLLEKASRLASRIIVRTNLVILKEPAYHHLIDLFAHYKVELVASLPDIDAKSVDDVRGKGVYEDSLTIIKELNQKGYAQHPSLVLDFVYNPEGASLPKDPVALEKTYKAFLWEKEGIVFNHLWIMNNVPIGRFAHHLRYTKTLDAYLEQLKTHFNPSTIKHLMCRSHLSVAYDGRVYDCDFNQMIDLSSSTYKTLDEILQHGLHKRHIAFDEHCYACSAGAGSSCQGAISVTPS